MGGIATILFKRCLEVLSTRAWEKGCLLRMGFKNEIHILYHLMLLRSTIKLIMKILKKSYIHFDHSWTDILRLHDDGQE